MKNKFKLAIISLIIFRVVLAFVVWHPDVNNHIDWGIRFFDYGPQEFYSPDANVWSYTWPNQPPGTTLMFAGIYQIYLFVFSILTWINQNIPLFPSDVMFFLEDRLYPAMLQLPAIIADLGIALLIYRIVKKHSSEKIAKAGALLFLINPAVWFNSSVWGQYDAVINFFGLLSFYSLYRKKYLITFLALALSIYIKISLAIFIPILLVLILQQKIKLKILVKPIIITVIVFSLVTFLFSYPNNPITWLYDVYTKKVLYQQLHVITANAFNVWAALTGIHEQPDSLVWGPFSYQFWGYILYTPIYLFSLWKIWKSKNEIKAYTWIAVIAFATFVLMTNMHERYIYPLFPYFTVVVVLNPRIIWLYVSVSIISLLNLYNFWFTPRIEPVVKIMEYGDRLAPRILGAVNTGLFVLFLKKINKNA